MKGFASSACICDS